MVDIFCVIEYCVFNYSILRRNLKSENFVDGCIQLFLLSNFIRSCARENMDN